MGFWGVGHGHRRYPPLGHRPYYEPVVAPDQLPGRKHHVLQSCERMHVDMLSEPQWWAQFEKARYEVPAQKVVDRPPPPTLEDRKPDPYLPSDIGDDSCLGSARVRLTADSACGRGANFESVPRAQYYL